MLFVLVLLLLPSVASAGQVRLQWKYPPTQQFRTQFEAEIIALRNGQPVRYSEPVSVVWPAGAIPPEGLTCAAQPPLLSSCPDATLARDPENMCGTLCLDPGVY